MTSNDRGSKAHNLNHLAWNFFCPSLEVWASHPPPVATRRLGRIQLENGNTFLGRSWRRLEGTGFVGGFLRNAFFGGKKGNVSNGFFDIFWVSIFWAKISRLLLSLCTLICTNWQTKIWCDTVDGRNPANQLRVVVYPVIYRESYLRGGDRRISSINSRVTTVPLENWTAATLWRNDEVIRLLNWIDEFITYNMAKS